MSNKEIVILAMIFATIVVIVWKAIENKLLKMNYDKRVKRTDYLKQLVKEDKIPFTLINIDNEPNRIAPTIDNNGLIIDNKVYNDKNAMFLEEDGKIYVLGTKEDFVIALVGGYVTRKWGN